MRTPWEDENNSEDIVEEVNSDREMVACTRRGQSSFIRLVMGMGKLHWTTGRLEGKRGEDGC